MTTERVLVTGATGFTGGHLCERLVRDGHSVRALARHPNNCPELRRLGVEVVAGDLRDSASVEKATQGIDVVYHIAALFRLRTSLERRCLRQMSRAPETFLTLL